MEKVNDWQWIDKLSTTSTNDDAIAFSGKCRTEKFIISAVTQTKGRGRRGRKWFDGEGNLFFSQGLRFPLRFLGQLVCLSSLSLWQTIDALLPAPHKVNIKWPNDILIDGQKVSGTLLEKGANDYLIIGTGVNIRRAPASEELVYPVCCLASCGINIDRTEFLRSYINNFDKNYALWQSSGFAEIRRQWLAAVKGLGEEISVHMTAGNTVGIFSGLGEDGELLLETDGKVKRIYAGDIFYIRKEK